MPHKVSSRSHVHPPYAYKSNNKWSMTVLVFGNIFIACIHDLASNLYYNTELITHTCIYAHTHTSIKPRHIWVRSRYYYSDQGLSRSVMLTQFQLWFGNIYMAQYSSRANLFLKSCNWNGLCLLLACILLTI